MKISFRYQTVSKCIIIFEGKYLIIETYLTLWILEGLHSIYVLPISMKQTDKPFELLNKLFMSNSLVL